MKKLITLLCILLNFSFAFGQSNINLIVPNLKDQKIDSMKAFDYSQLEMLNLNMQDTINMRFKKNNIDCYVIRFHIGKSVFNKQLWLDTGHITVKAHLLRTNLVVDTVLNSPIYYQVQQFQNEYFAVQKKSDSTAINQFLLRSFEQFKDNPFSITVGIYYLLHNINSKENLRLLKEKTDPQGQKFKYYITYTNLYDRLNTLLQLEKVDLNNFKFTNTENKKSSINLKSADYTIINFWFLNNRSSMQQHQTIKQYVEKLKAKNVQLVGLSIDQTPEDWNKYLTVSGITWPNYLEPSKNLLSDFLMIDNFPSYIVLNKEGKLLGTYFSFLDVMNYFKIE